MIAASNATATTTAPATFSGGVDSKVLDLTFSMVDICYQPKTVFKGTNTCAARGKTKKVVLVNQGESYQFNTNEADKYGANVKCLVTYKRRGSCKKMSVSCNQFSLAAGDMLRVQRGRNKQT